MPFHVNVVCLVCTEHNFVSTATDDSDYSLGTESANDGRPREVTWGGGSHGKRTGKMSDDGPDDRRNWNAWNALTRMQD